MPGIFFKKGLVDNHGSFFFTRPAVRFLLAVATMTILLLGFSMRRSLPVSLPQWRGQAVTNTIFVVLDLETTGLNSESDRIIEIGVVRFGRGMSVERRAWLLDPQVDISEAAWRVNGITSDMVVGAPVFSGVAAQLARFMSGAVLLSHNARFDRAFLSAELRRISCVRQVQQILWSGFFGVYLLSLL